MPAHTGIKVSRSAKPSRLSQGTARCAAQELSVVEFHISSVGCGSLGDIIEKRKSTDTNVLMINSGCNQMQREYSKSIVIKRSAGEQNCFITQ